MRVRLPAISVGRLGNSKLDEFLKTLIVLVLAAVITVGVYIYWHDRNKPKPSNGVVYKPSSISVFKNDFDPTAQAALSKGNYTQFQQIESLTAGEFTASKDYTTAENILNAVLAKVPGNKVDAVTYSAFVGLERAKGDKSQLKHYEQLLITLLQKQGNTAEAAPYQKELSSL